MIKSSIKSRLAAFKFKKTSTSPKSTNNANSDRPATIEKKKKIMISPSTTSTISSDSNTDVTIKAGTVTVEKKSVPVPTKNDSPINEKKSTGKLSKSRINSINIPLPGHSNPSSGSSNNDVNIKAGTVTVEKKSVPTKIENPSNEKKTAGKLSKSRINSINIPLPGRGIPPQHQHQKQEPGKSPPKINIYAGTTHSDHNSQGQAKMSEKAKTTIVAPMQVESEREDWDFLYELASRYDQYKLQEVEEIKNPNKVSMSEAKQKSPKKPHVQGDKKSITSSLEGMLGGTNFTASGKFITKEYFDQYIVENPKFSSVTFDFSNEGKLFKRFDRKDQEQRSISQKFVAALLKHPRASEITHLSMSNALLPDAFLIALSEQCLASESTNGGALPKLQVLKLESNLLNVDGIVALSKCIANPKVWCRLQILKLENQKTELRSTAEDALGDAVVHSRSLVVVGLRVRGGVPKQQIDNTVKANVDILRRARRKHASKTGALKERKRNEMEQYFDKIASNTDSSIVDVDLTGNLKFLGLNSVERTKSGKSFGTNTSVKSIKLVKLNLDDDFAEAFGAALVTNSTLETVILDSNSFSGTGIKSLLTGLGKNKSINSFQIRHQSKTISSSDEEILPSLLEDNTTVIKLGIDARNPLIKMKLDRKTNGNREYQRKQRQLNKK